MTEISDASDLYRWLESQNLLEQKPQYWWPNYGSFEVVVGAILTQNTKWEKVELSLDNLRRYDLLSLDKLAACDLPILMELITPSGLYKTKALYLKKLVDAIAIEFCTFEAFKDEVEREWLLLQKGIGPETADSILCYACERPEMVVDAYTARLLRAFGLDYETYDDIKHWCSDGVQLLFDADELAYRYALLHGMIVEYVKRNSKGKTVYLND